MREGKISARRFILNNGTPLRQSENCSKLGYQMSPSALGHMDERKISVGRFILNNGTLLRQSANNSKYDYQKSPSAYSDMASLEGTFYIFLLNTINTHCMISNLHALSIFMLLSAIHEV